MPNDPLIEAIKTAIDNLRNELAPYTDPTDEDIAQAALAAIAEAGYAVVPREPTFEMLVAGNDIIAKQIELPLKVDIDGDFPDEVYKVMLSAAALVGRES